MELGFKFDEVEFEFVLVVVKLDGFSLVTFAVVVFVVAVVVAVVVDLAVWVVVVGELVEVLWVFDEFEHINGVFNWNIYPHLSSFLSLFSSIILKLSF